MLWALGLLKETFKRLCECKLCFQQTPFADTCASRNAVPFAHGAPELRVMGAESGIFRGLSCLPGPPALRPHTTMAQGEEESRARQPDSLVETRTWASSKQNTGGAGLPQALGCLHALAVFPAQSWAGVCPQVPSYIPASCPQGACGGFLCVPPLPRLSYRDSSTRLKLNTLRRLSNAGHRLACVTGYRERRRRLPC